MGELMDYIKERYMHSDRSDTQDLKHKQLVKNKIAELCDSKIKEAGDVLTFQVTPSELPFATAVISEEPLRTKYYIYQIDETLFSAQLQEIGL